MILGSLFISLGAMLLSIPLGLFSAILCQFYAPAWFSHLLQRVAEVLSGIPSVIFGFWGVIAIVPLLAQIQAPGTNILAGILVLSFIILPMIILIANNAFQNVDHLNIQNAIALGLSRYSIIKYIIFPQAKRGLLTGMILQSGRAIGETLAVLMVCGNVVQIPGSIFDPVRTLTSNIALEMAYAMDIHRSALFFNGLILMLVVLALMLFAEKFESSTKAK
jgi:phosphate transport system permease protein